MLRTPPLPPTDAGRLGAEKRLFKLFGTMDAVDKFYRMYLRGRSIPERMSSSKVEHSGGIATYGELEPA